MFEWFRKNPGKDAQVFENLGIGNRTWEHHLFVGNQANHRTSFLAIGVIRWKARGAEAATRQPRLDS